MDRSNDVSRLACTKDDLSRHYKSIQSKMTNFFVEKVLMMSKPKNFIQKWVERLQGSRSGPPEDSPAETGAPAQSFEQMVLRMAQMTDDTELSCDEVLALLDQFTERALRGDDVARLMPLVQRHLDRCRDCMEEYHALERILRAAPAL
jgi:hypothetical protein